MDERDDEPPPFWLQSTTTLHQVNHHHRRHRHRYASSLFLNTGVLITFLLVTAIIFLLILIPYLFSHAKKLFNPHLFKSSWNSLNIILVLFAILCGFLSRKEDDQTTPLNTPTRSRSRSTKDAYKPDSNPTQWYGYHDRSFGNVENVTRLRSSSSYPDLRQDSAKWRFYDDTDVENYQFRRSDTRVISPLKSFRKMDESEDVDRVEVNNIEINPRIIPEPESELESIDVSPTFQSPSPSVIDKELVRSGSDELDIKNIEMGVDQPKDVDLDPEVDVQKTYIPPPSPAMSVYPPPSPTSYFWPPPPPPPPPPRRRKTPIPNKETNQTFETIGYGRYKWNNSSTNVPKTITPAPPPPPPSQTPPQSRNESSGRKRGGVNVTKDFFTSFYNQSKRKRKHNKRRSYENLETFIDDQQPPKVSIHRSKSTPEFPPPSPPPPHPPPPPPPQSVFQSLFSKKINKPKKRHPVKKQDSVKTVNVPLVRQIPAPPPPPSPPPFNIKPWRFVIESNNSSPRSGYYASEDESISPTSTKNSPTQTNANANTNTQTLFYPSPDVNMKADDFIAKFRAKLTLEKSDSINLKQGTGPSRLRPDF